MKYFIKNMVSIRCKIVVKSELERLNLHYTSVRLGEIDTPESLTMLEFANLHKGLYKAGLELMDNTRSILIEKMRNIIIEMIHYSGEMPGTNFSEFISKKLNQNYTYLANLFKEVHCTTINQFIILHKIERVKELLTYDEMSLTKIAYLMQYSSVAALATQFKKITGLTSQQFIKMHGERRKILKGLYPL